MKNSLLLLAAAVALAVGIVWVFGIGGAKTTVVKDPATGKDVKVGALTGPDIPSPYLNWGGTRIYNYAMALTQGASTTCSFLSPASTSTLMHAGIKFDTASSSALILDIGKATNQYATTTAIGTTYNIGAGEDAFVLASTTPTGGAVTVFAPNTYLNFKIGNGTAGNFALSAPVGRCQAMFVEYPTI